VPVALYELWTAQRFLPTGLARSAYLPVLFLLRAVFTQVKFGSEDKVIIIIAVETMLAINSDGIEFLGDL